MRIIVTHNIDKKIYHAYIPMVGYSADIPEEAFSQDRVLELIKIYTKDKVKLDIQEPLDSSNAIELPIENKHPTNGKQYLSFIRFHTEYSLEDFPYLTVEYSGKVYVHKDFPSRDFDNDYWASEVQEPIGYLPEGILTEEEDNDEDLYQNVFKCVET
jgi:hypothetical protein